MLTRPSVPHVVREGHHSLRLDCEFQMAGFSLFLNPIVWTKSQLGKETTSINFQGNVLEPFLSTGRFNTELETSPDKRRLNPQLTIYRKSNLSAATFFLRGLY